MEKRLLYRAYPRHCFSPRGLVHIYIPRTRTPRGRVIGLKVLPTLVGHSLWDCLVLAFCTCIIAHIRLLVKYFFEKFQFIFVGFRLHTLLSVSVVLLRVPTAGRTGKHPMEQDFLGEILQNSSLCFYYSTLGWICQVLFYFLSKGDRIYSTSEMRLITYLCP